MTTLNSQKLHNPIFVVVVILGFIFDTRICLRHFPTLQMISIFSIFMYLSTYLLSSIASMIDSREEQWTSTYLSEICSNIRTHFRSLFI